VGFAEVDTPFWFLIVVIPMFNGIITALSIAVLGVCLEILLWIAQGRSR
jgi:hypothetical protein